MAIQVYPLAASFWGIFFLFSLYLPNTNAGRRDMFNAIYQFGDSISDTGNFMRKNVTNISACSALPYGKTYFGYPTGRCSDGLLMVDFVAKHFGLPFLKPYLDASANFSHGVDFAIISATALSAATLEAKGLEVLVANDSLPVEMGWFHTYLQSICSSSQSCRARLRRSLFIIEIGGNDINFAFFERKSFQFVYSLIPDIVQAIKNATQEIIDVGATHILVPGNFPIGCIPIYRTIFASNDTSQYDDLKCLKNYNQVAKLQNDQIQKAIIELHEKHPRVHISYVNFYEAYTYLLRNAASLGFEEDQVFNPCCGSLSSYNHCGSEGAPLCANPKTRVSWDGTHPTHQANKYMARWILSHISS